MPNLNDIRLLLYAQRRGLLDASKVAVCFSDMLASEREGKALRVMEAMEQRNLLPAALVEELMRQMLDVTASGEVVVGADTFLDMQQGVDSALESGQEIGGFKLTQEVARDGMSVTFKARTEEYEWHRLRILTSEAAKNRDVVQRFHSDAILAMEIEHDFLVEVQGVACEDGFHHVVMPWIEAYSLAEMLPRRAWTPMATVRTVHQVAETCALIHAKGLVHLDIEPAKILLDSTGDTLLTGLALGKDTLRRETMGTEYCKLLGTPAYLSPEQARGDAEKVGTWSDVYALGAVLFRAVTGRFPHIGETFVQTLRAIVKNDPPLIRMYRPDAPQELEELIAHCMQRSPRKRPTAEMLAEQLTEVLQLEPVALMPHPGG